MVDTSELLRVFGSLSLTHVEQVIEQHVTGDTTDSEQVIRGLKQEVEHLRTLVSAQGSHIDSLKQAMLLLEHKQEQPVPQMSSPVHSSWWKFWK